MNPHEKQFPISKHMRIKLRTAKRLHVGLILSIAFVSALAHGQLLWVATWTTSPTGVPDSESFVQWNEAHPKIAWKGATIVRGTLRYRFRIAAGGEKIRLTVSNTYKQASLYIGGMTVGLAGNDLDVAMGTLREVRFSGNLGTKIPAGVREISDPVDLPVTRCADLIVSISIPDGAAIMDYPLRPDIPLAEIADGSDQIMETHLHEARRLDTRPLLSEVDVLTAKCRNVIVALGDSITDGMVSDGERGWPGALARRLAPEDISVVNAGIGGNRLLSPMGPVHRAALARLNDDVLTIPGITHIVLLEGINDIGNSGSDWEPFGSLPNVTAADLVSAYRQIISKAHMRNIRVIGATILPFKGAFYYSEEKEAIRASVNEWIRTSGQFDGVIDFDLAIRDPALPSRIRADLAADPLHPNSKGYRLMGDLIDVNLFK
jgi:lysophospholipase L1-like esterase